MIRTMLLGGAAALALAVSGPALAAGNTSGQDKAQDAKQTETRMQQSGSQDTWRDSDAQAGSTKVRPLTRDQAGRDVGPESKAARDDAQVGQGSDLEGERYSDLQGRQVYTREGNELGSVQGATTDERGEIDGFIVAGGPALGPHLLFIPVDFVRPGQGAGQDLEADVGRQDVDKMMQEWQKSGQDTGGRGLDRQEGSGQGQGGSTTD